MVVGEELEPYLRLAVVRRLVDPEPVGAEDEARGRRFLVERLEADRVAVEGDDRLVLMRRHLHRDVDTTRDRHCATSLKVAAPSPAARITR
ncbi:hypothetical protein D9M70_646930 [compost metagenome]